MGLTHQEFEAVLPACSRSATTSGRPTPTIDIPLRCLATRSSAVNPSQSRMLTSAPASSSNRTTAACPATAARCRAVDPISVVCLSTYAPRRSRSLTASTCPARDAYMRGEYPDEVAGCSSHWVAGLRPSSWSCSGCLAYERARVGQSASVSVRARRCLLPRVRVRVQVHAPVENGF